MQSPPAQLLPLALAVALPLGCSRNSDERLAQVQHRQSVIDARVAADEKRAAELRSEVQQLEQTLAVQRQCVEWHLCWAQIARVRAAVAAQLAECNRNTANWFACDAQRTRNKAEGAGLGCLIGWGAAIVTGGSAAPAVAIGCGIGAAHGEGETQGVCRDQPRPQQCGQMQQKFTETALASQGLSTIPLCKAVPPECLSSSSPSQ